MDQDSLKTSTKQRIFIALIAIVMLGSIIASYAAIVISGGSNTSATNPELEAKISELSAKYEAKSAEVDTASTAMSDRYFAEFSAYKSEVKAYNETSANDNGIQSKDLKIGTGRELTDGDTNYFAYYIGWCADETIFDSSLNDSSLKAPLAADAGLIEGWNLGVVGMKLGGVRELTIPGELAYGESREICGGTNKPLKFVVMALEKTEPLATLVNELNSIGMELQYAYYGIDLSAQQTSENTEVSE